MIRETASNRVKYSREAIRFYSIYIYLSSAVAVFFFYSIRVHFFRVKAIKKVVKQWWIETHKCRKRTEASLKTKHTAATDKIKRLKNKHYLQTLQHNFQRDEIIQIIRFGLLLLLLLLCFRWYFFPSMASSFLIIWLSSLFFFLSLSFSRSLLILSLFLHFNVSFCKHKKKKAITYRLTHKIIFLDGFLLVRLFCF